MLTSFMLSLSCHLQKKKNLVSLGSPLAFLSHEFISRATVTKKHASWGRCILSLLQIPGAFQSEVGQVSVVIAVILILTSGIGLHCFPW